ncbi:Lactate dehydrogenase [Roseivivax marinus]|uniref:2-hydroxyacid dehydrogenase n=1 Tax=Roseivivax marinus TaxID=1379903 RepID=UPI0008C36B16|nr:2-hydroxyacid dehydrogenase [Roseivivax marinus]SEL74173.1 Lactate dehydrogenase [Roseivivax marinus]
MSRTLAVGTYSEEADAALSETFDPVRLAAIADLASLDETTRAGIEAVAYKGGGKPFGPAEMDLLPKLGLIANFGVGYDAIDTGAAQERGIAVTNTPDVLNDDVADFAIALWLMQRRSTDMAGRWLRDGRWASEGPPPLAHTASGGRAGVLGLGRIGHEIADRLAAFKMDVHYYARSEKETPGWTFHADPVDLAASVDVLFVALKGGPETAGFVTREMIEAVGPGGCLVNIARGNTVDEEALIAALQDGRLGGAGLDVFVGEPEVDPRLLALPNAVLQPHHATSTHECRAAMGRVQRDNIRAFLDGRPLPTRVA